MAASSSQHKMMNNELSELVGQLSLEERRLNRQNRGAAAAEARLGQAAHPAAAAAAAQRVHGLRNRIHALQGRIAEIQQSREAHAASRHHRVHRTSHEESGFHQKKPRQTPSTHNVVRRSPSANNDSEDEDAGARASTKRSRPQGGANRSARRNRRNTCKNKNTRRRHK